MWHLPRILSIFGLLALFGCLAGTGQKGGALVPSATSPYSASGPSDGASELAGESGDTDQKAAGVGGDGPGGGSGGSQSTFSDTPITVIAFPMGSTPKRPPDCEEAYALCFRGVTLVITGEMTEDGRVPFDVKGTLVREDNLEPLVGREVTFFDMRDPPKKLGFLRTLFPDASFQVSMLGSPGLSVEFRASECRSKLALNVVIPDSTAGTVVLGDVCGPSPPLPVVKPPLGGMSPILLDAGDGLPPPPDPKGL